MRGAELVAALLPGIEHDLVASSTDVKRLVVVDHERLGGLRLAFQRVDANEIRHDDRVQPRRVVELAVDAGRLLDSTNRQQRRGKSRVAEHK